MKSSPDYVALYGLNSFEIFYSATNYIKALYDLGVIGPGKEIDTAPLPMDSLGKAQFYEALTRAIATRTGIGKYLAEGTARFAAALGRWEQDTASGILAKPQWGYEAHNSAPEVSFAFGSLVDSRDVDDHCWFNLFSAVNRAPIGHDNLPADKAVELLSQKTIPYTDDPYMFDWSPNWPNNETGIYSEHFAKLMVWHRHYTRYYKQSLGMCDWYFPQFVNANMPDYAGLTPNIEADFINAVTGSEMSFADGIEIGRNIWNLHRAILCLEGRHRDIEKFTEYCYTTAFAKPSSSMAHTGGLTVYKNGKWDYADPTDLYFEKEGVEAYKTTFYKLEGWDPNTGWPTRKTLEELGA
jgi:aldehyde:ferredoxin oxidoreductase